MMKYLYLSCCLFWACFSPLHAQQTALKGDTSADQREVEDQIVALERRYWEAWKNKDTKTLAQIRAEDFREADHDGVWDKKRAEQGDLDLVTTAFTMSSEKVSVLDANVALLTYEIAYKASYKGKDISSSHSYIASLYERRKGDWRLVYTQESLANDSQAIANSTVTDPPKPEPDSFFIEKEKEVWEAIKNKNKAADSRLLADDFVGLYDTGFAAKPDHVNQMDDKYAIESYNVQGGKVLRLSPTMALLLYKATCNGSGASEQYCSRPDYVSSLWVERDGHWVNLFSQDTQATESESDDAVLKAIVANEQKEFEALSKNDFTAFGNMLPDDLIDVEDDGIHTKAEWLKGFEEQKNSELLFKEFKLYDLRLVRYAPSPATLVFKETIDGTQNGKPFVWHINGTATYVKRNGKWMPILYAETFAK